MRNAIQIILVIAVILNSVVFSVSSRACSLDDEANFHQIWLSASGTPTSGNPWDYTAQSTPYVIQPNSDGRVWLDWAIYQIVTWNAEWNQSGNPTHKVVINLLDGTYYSSGILLNSGITTAIKLRGQSRVGTKIYYELYGTSWQGFSGALTAIRAADIQWAEVCKLTVDLQWTKNWNTTLDRPQADGGFKIGGVGLASSRAWVHDVDVRDAGSCGANYYPGGGLDASQEVFPITVSKRRLSPDTSAYSDGNHMKVTSCFVRPITGIAGASGNYVGVGYATGILVTAETVNALSNQKVLVKDCQVSGTPSTIYSAGKHQMHAYGVAAATAASLIEFDNCYGSSTTSAFNCDTPPVKNVRIKNSWFSGNQGIHVGGGGTFQNFEILNNTFWLMGPFVNPYYSAPIITQSGKQRPFGVYFSGGVTASTVSGNTIYKYYNDDPTLSPQGYCILIPYNGNSCVAPEANHPNGHLNFDYWVGTF